MGIIPAGIVDPQAHWQTRRCDPGTGYSAVGVVLSITVIGAVIGIPLVLLGLMLMIKAILG
jgi:hypothetical protein